jgi:hypothetical protein
MQLRCLAGRYAGQTRTYATAVGLAALRSGTAARLGAEAIAPHGAAAGPPNDAAPVRPGASGAGKKKQK